MIPPKDNIFPKVFIVEYNAKFFPPIEFIIDYDENHKWTGDDYFGASLTSLEKLFKKLKSNYNKKKFISLIYNQQKAFGKFKHWEKIYQKKCDKKDINFKNLII